ncbi:porin [Agaribacterium sp. ZY112]|uniref:porin n=1 Tax=Agaribacterium sp. ZY112 TaxID=3233574 RepID=UPI0035265E0B
MKKISLIPAVAALATVGAYAESPTVYGKVNVALQNADEADSSKLELVSNASRLGVKGKLDIEDTGLKGIYQIEFEVAADDGTAGKDGNTITQRNTFVGLQGGFGTAKAGIFDTPLKVAQKKVDLFNDLEGDIKHIITVNDNRPDNIVQYSTPKFADVVSLNGAVIASEDEDVDNGFSGSITADMDFGLYLAAAYDTGVESEEADVARLVAQYKVAGFQFGVLYETMEEGDADSVDGYVLSAQYAPNKWAFKVQAGNSDIKEEDGQTYSLGVDYKFNKKFKTFVYYTDNQYVDGAADVESSYLGLGTELKF